MPYIYVNIDCNCILLIGLHVIEQGEKKIRINSNWSVRKISYTFREKPFPKNLSSAKSIDETEIMTHPFFQLK